MVRRVVKRTKTAAPALAKASADKATHKKTFAKKKKARKKKAKKKPAKRHVPIAAPDVQRKKSKRRAPVVPVATPLVINLTPTPYTPLCEHTDVLEFAVWAMDYSPCQWKARQYVMSWIDEYLPERDAPSPDELYQIMCAAKQHGALRTEESREQVRAFVYRTYVAILDSPQALERDRLRALAGIVDLRGLQETAANDETPEALAQRAIMALAAIGTEVHKAAPDEDEDE